MGIIITKGEASQKVKADQMKIKITFGERNTEVHVSSKNVLDQCDLFLTELEKLGIKADMVQLVDSTVEFSRYRDDEKSEAERTISMNFKYDTAMINTILDLLNHGQYTYEFDVTYSYSKQAELKASLLQAAIENAKKQAESICESLGTKILGIEEVQSDKDQFFMDKTKDFVFYEELQCHRPSDLLGNPLIKASKEVVIKWITG